MSPTPDPAPHAAARDRGTARGLGRAGPAGLGLLRTSRCRAWCRTWCCSSWWPPASRTARELGLVLGFGAGLLLDLAPPADHYAGRWALALVVVGYVAGRLRPRAASRRPVAAGGRGGSFVGTSVFALTGLLLRDPAVGVGELLRVEVVALAWDVRARAGRRTPRRSDCSRRSSPTGSWRDQLVRRRAPQPAPAGGDPGAGVLAVRDPAGPALLPPGRQRGRVRRPGRLAVGPRDRRAAAARADRRRQGRPLVANRTSWVVSIDRGTLAKLPEAEQRALLHRVARVTDVAVPRIQRLLTTCGDDKAVQG